MAIALRVAESGNLFSFSREIDCRLAIENLSIAILEIYPNNWGCDIQELCLSKMVEGE